MFPFWKFYATLHGQRQVGPSGPQPLGITDIYSLAQMMGLIRSDDMEFLLEVIPMMDQKYLDHYYTAREKKLKSNTSKPRSPKRQ